MAVVTKIVNLISSQALNKRKFDALLDEVNSVYNGLLINNVRWLSRRNVFQRFVDCLEEIRLFLQNEGKIEQYPQLLDVMWLSKLMFFTDICQRVNELNVKLQGTNKTIIVMIDLIRALDAKLHVFRNDIITRNYKYFPNLKKNINDLDIRGKPVEETVTEEFISVIDSSINEFSARFSHFKELSETLKFIMYPDVISFDKLNLSQFDWLEIEEFEMQLIDFQSSSTWIQKFIETRDQFLCTGAEEIRARERSQRVRMDYLPMGATVNADRYCATLEILRWTIQWTRGMLRASIVFLTLTIMRRWARNNFCCRSAGRYLTIPPIVPILLSAFAPCSST
ncbi:General transcription factor II-I repeat domain-containing protein 2A [Araneus ventricosus]|uniref:General transcription factor II-I repeat domain-containing protein 2A n=1 Tax=Araneus ventricosus TaxID=182803 RepID=A0A4Y2KBP0_ARAVE|nr:General transcription factor II-I repeat domain-containing protein 2A [Araneus ventricosus]